MVACMPSIDCASVSISRMAECSGGLGEKSSAWMARARPASSTSEADTRPAIHHASGTTTSTSIPVSSSALAPSARAAASSSSSGTSTASRSGGP